MNKDVKNEYRNNILELSKTYNIITLRMICKCHKLLLLNVIIIVKYSSTLEFYKLF